MICPQNTKAHWENSLRGTFNYVIGFTAARRNINTLSICSVKCTILLSEAACRRFHGGKSVTHMLLTTGSMLHCVYNLCLQMFHSETVLLLHCQGKEQIRNHIAEDCFQFPSEFPLNDAPTLCAVRKPELLHTLWHRRSRWGFFLSHFE